MGTYNIIPDHWRRLQQTPAPTLALILACVLVIVLNLRWYSQVDYPQINKTLLEKAAPIILTGCVLSLILLKGKIGEALSIALIWMKSVGRREVNLCNTLGLNSLRVFNNRFIELHRAKKIRIVSILSLSGHPTILAEEETTGRTLYQYETVFNRLTDFFLALRAHEMQFAYLTSLLPLESREWDADQRIKELEEELDKKNYQKTSSERSRILFDIERIREKKLGHCYSGVVLVAIWVDIEKTSIEQGRQKIESLTNSLTISLDTVFPEMEATQLEGISLLRIISGFLYPSEPFQ